MKQITDADLYRLAVEGERSAVRAIAERYHAEMLRHAYAKTSSRPQAEDAVANAWLRFFRHLKAAGESSDRAMRKPESLRFWLLTATRNSLLDIYRAEQRQADLVERAKDDAQATDRLTYQPDFLERLTDAERRQVVMSAFRRIGDACRELLSLLILDPPMEYSEIAAVLGRPVGWVGPTRQRCIARLRSMVTS